MEIYVLAAAGILALFLYRRGLMTTKRIAAVFFLFRPGKNRDQVSLNSCSGWVRHRGQFRESGSYEFRLDFGLSKGGAEVSLLDGEKRELLRLNWQQSAGTAELKRKGRYYLRWEFKGATGKCELWWERRI